MAKTTTVTGYASIFDEPYTMWDMFGEYEETVAPGAFAASIADSPDVVLRANHIQLPLASTYAGTLEMWEDETGLGFTAQVDTSRNDAADVIAAIQAGDLRETSMAGTIVRGKWSRDYQTFTITEFDLNRGDVGPVTYGANPAGYISVGTPAARDDTTEIIKFQLALEAA